MFGSLLSSEYHCLCFTNIDDESVFFHLTSSFNILSECSSSSLFSFRRSTSSANRRLLLRIPFTVIPLCLSLFLSIAQISRSAMNTVGDIGTPCLVPQY